MKEGLGTFHVAIEVGDAGGRNFQRMEAPVDTGATHLVVPRNVLTELGCESIERQSFALADGRVAEYDVGVVPLRLDGRTLTALCIFGDETTEPLLGAVALESFLLSADPVDSVLVPVLGRQK